MTNRSTYVAFRRTIRRRKFTLTSEDLFFYRTYSKVITYISVGVVRQCADDFKQNFIKCKI